MLVLSFKAFGDVWQGFIQDFSLEGEIIACSNVLKLAGSGGMLPQEKFEVHDLCDCFWWLLRPQKFFFIRIIMVVREFQGEASQGGYPLVPTPLNKSLYGVPSWLIILLSTSGSVP